MEQVCHHPPISYMHSTGPNNSYRFYGYSAYTPKAHMNSIDVQTRGMKAVEFNDGTKITFNPHDDQLMNTVWGTLVHLVCGKIEFKDEKNGLTAWYHIDSLKKKPRDYF